MEKSKLTAKRSDIMQPLKKNPTTYELYSYVKEHLEEGRACLDRMRAASVQGHLALDRLRQLRMSRA